MQTEKGKIFVLNINNKYKYYYNYIDRVTVGIPNSNLIIDIRDQNFLRLRHKELSEDCIYIGNISTTTNNNMRILITIMKYNDSEILSRKLSIIKLKYNEESKSKNIPNMENQALKCDNTSSFSGLKYIETKEEKSISDMVSEVEKPVLAYLAVQFASFEVLKPTFINSIEYYVTADKRYNEHTIFDKQDDVLFDFIDENIKLRCMKRLSEYDYQDYPSLAIKLIANALSNEELLDTGTYELYQEYFLKLSDNVQEKIISMIELKDDRINYVVFWHIKSKYPEFYNIIMSNCVFVTNMNNFFDKYKAEGIFLNENIIYKLSAFIIKNNLSSEKLLIKFLKHLEAEPENYKITDTKYEISVETYGRIKLIDAKTSRLTTFKYE